MAIFLVERNVNEDDAKQVAEAARGLVSAEITHLKTYITPSKIYSLLDAPSAEQLRRLSHHKQYTIHRIAEVQQKQDEITFEDLDTTA